MRRKEIDSFDHWKQFSNKRDFTTLLEYFEELFRGVQKKKADDKQNQNERIITNSKEK